MAKHKLHAHGRCWHSKPCHSKASQLTVFSIFYTFNIFILHIYTLLLLITRWMIICHHHVIDHRVVEHILKILEVVSRLIPLIIKRCLDPELWNSRGNISGTCICYIINSVSHDGAWCGGYYQHGSVPCSTNNLITISCRNSLSDHISWKKCIACSVDGWNPLRLNVPVFCIHVDIYWECVHVWIDDIREARQIWWIW